MLLSDGKLKEDERLLVAPKRFAFCAASPFLAEAGRRLLMTPSTFINLLPSVLCPRS